MPYCSNCDSHVSHDYVRVFSVEGEISICPRCPDKTRESIDTESVSPGSADLSNQGDPDWLQSMLSPDEEKRSVGERTHNSALVW